MLLIIVKDKTLTQGQWQVIKDRKIKPNVKDCTQMLQAFTKLQVPVVGELRAFMKENSIQCDNKVWASMIEACSQSRAFEIRKQVHKEIQLAGRESDLFLCTSLVNMYGRTGELRTIRKTLLVCGHQ